MTTPGSPNAEQIEYWNEQAGPRWVLMQNAIDAQIGPVGLAAMDRAALRPGERVLDVGCGCGSSTLVIAGRVQPGGSVSGVDLSAPMLAEARRRAAAAGLTAELLRADAQTHAFVATTFDVVFSRFGVMFFADPVAAFTNLAAALAPGGRLTFVCWQALDRNPWLLVPLGAVIQHVTPPPSPEPGAPGPFSLADPARVRDILGRAGFVDVQVDPHETTMTMGGGDSALDDAIRMLFEIGPAGRLVRDADASTRAKVAEAMRDVLTPYCTADGVRLGAAAWIVHARR